MDTTIYYRFAGVRLPDCYDTAETAIADAGDGEEVYRETRSATRWARTRVWPTVGTTEEYEDDLARPRQYH